MRTVVQSSLHQFKRNTSLLYLSIIILLFGVFFTAIYKLENYAITQQERSFNDQQLLQTQITKRATQNNLDNIKRFALEFSSNNKQTNLQGEVDHGYLEIEVARAIAYYPAILGINIYNKRRELIFDSQQNFEQSLIEKNTETITVKQTVDKWIKQNWIALNSPEIDLIVPTFQITETSQIFALLVPIRTARNFKGVLVTIVDLSILSEQFIAPMRSGEHGAAYMLNENGVVLYDHETEIIGRNVYDGLHENYPDVQRIDQLLLSQLSGQGEYHFTVTRKNKEKISRKLVSWDTAKIDNRKLIIALSAPDTEIIGPIQGLRQQGILLAVFLSLGLVTVTILFYRNTNKALWKTTQRLEDEVNIRTKSFKKIEKSFRDTVQNSGIGIYRTSPDGRLLMANPYFVRLHNSNSEEELIQAASNRDEDWYIEKNRRDELLQSIKENGYVEGFVSKIKTYHNCEEKWISETTRAIRDEQDEIIYYEGTVQDVSHLVHAREAQKITEANLRAHITAMPDLGIIFSISGKVINIYGDKNLLVRSRKDMIGFSLHDLATKENAEKWLTIIEKTHKSGEVQTIEYCLEIKHDPRWFEARTALIKEIEKTPARIVILIRDITQHHLDKLTMLKTLEKADTAHRTQSEFLAYMSHEIRGPLNSILGYSDIMDQELFGPLNNKKYHGYVSDIHTSGKQLLTIVNDIFDISEIESGNYILEETLFELPKIVEETNLIVSGLAVEKNITYTSTSLPQVSLFADARVIKIILINILSIALKYTPEGGKVELSARLDETGIEILVEDTGIGLKSLDLENVPEPFFRVGTTLARDISGTGIDLSLSRKLIEFHQGTLIIYSSLNDGTKTLIMLPKERIVAQRKRA